MRFSCEKAILQTAVTTAGRVVAPKSSIQALEGVLIEAEGDSLSLSGYNLETGIVTTVPADVAEGGPSSCPPGCSGRFCAGCRTMRCPSR